MVDAEEVVKLNPKIQIITETRQDLKCQFCLKHEINELEWGPLYKLDDIVAHYFCMLFSAALTRKGNDEEGILGFLANDLKKEIQRGQRLKCKYCKKNRATVGCIIPDCKAAYHFPCGLANGTLNHFTGNYASYCSKHKALPKLPFRVPLEGVLCDICEENVRAFENWVWPPCCQSKFGQRLYHRSCIQEYAKRAGYSFACPSCKDTAVFIDAMKKSGVFIPDQEAAWERDPTYFQELTEMYSTCDVKVCHCPHGRNYDADYSESANRNWKIVRCGVCGSSAVHYCCGQLQQMKWTCGVCIKVIPGGTPGLLNTSESSDDPDVESVNEEYEIVCQIMDCRAATAPDLSD